MKQLVLAGVVSLVSGAALADKPLTIQNSIPATLGTSPNYVSNTSNVDSKRFAIQLGYAGTKIDSSAIDKARFNGFEITASYDFDAFGVWAKYEQQKDGKLDFDQYSTGLQYTLFNNSKTYVTAAAGVGIAKFDNSFVYKYPDTTEFVQEEDGDGNPVFDNEGQAIGDDITEIGRTVTIDQKASYLFIPVRIELGHMLTPNVGVYSSLGYKWFENDKLKVYEDGVKMIDKQSRSARLNGLSYGFGVRFAF